MTRLIYLSLIALTAYFFTRKDTAHRLIHYQKSCFVSGQISGLLYIEYSRNFQFASKAVQALDLIPRNPVTLFANKSWSWSMYMVACIYELLFCRSVYFQFNWKDSRGARIEHFVAVITMKRCYYEDGIK